VNQHALFSQQRKSKKLLLTLNTALCALKSHSPGVLSTRVSPQTERLETEK
jgi:hypothetical protein